MTELKLSEIKGLLIPKIKSNAICTWLASGRESDIYIHGYNTAISKLSTKNLLDYVETVVCKHTVVHAGEKIQCHYGKISIGYGKAGREEICPNCNGTGAVIRVKEKA